MKKLSAALAVSASAMVISVGWYSLQSAGRMPSPLPNAIALSSSPKGGLAPESHTENAPTTLSQEEEALSAGNMIDQVSSNRDRAHSRQSLAPFRITYGGMPKQRELLTQRSQPSSPSSVQQHSGFSPISTPILAVAEPAVTILGERSIGYVDVELRPGTQFPVALAEDTNDTPLAMVEAKEQIAEEFETEILEAAAKGKPASKDIERIWTEAQERADRRLRLFYGKAAYNRESLRAGQKPPAAKQQ